MSGSCGYGIGNEILEPGETCDVTPTVPVINGMTIIWKAWNYRSRTVNVKLVRTYPRSVYVDRYINYLPNGIAGWLWAPAGGTYQMELRCTTDSTVYRDCHASAWFVAGW